MSMPTKERRYREGNEPIRGFVLVKFLGAGAFGEVWKASSPGGVDVALKILYKIDRRAGRKAFCALQRVKNIRNPHLLSIFAFWLKDEYGNILDDDAAAGFEAEQSGSGSIPPEDVGLRNTLGPDELEGDQVRQTPGASTRPAELIICMQLADETIWDCLERYQSAGKRGIPREELMRYIEGAAKGLDYLNVQHEIYHGDVKPQNLMVVGGEGQVSDFDLAKNLGDSRATSSGACTIAYAPPEVIAKKNPSPTSDQYALAISYFELRTGALPYLAEDLHVVITAKISGNLELASLPKAERRVVAKATSLDPAKRYRNSIDFVHALRGPGPSGRVSLKMAAAGLLGIAVLLGIWWRAVPSPWDLESVARRYFSSAEEQINAKLREVDEKTQIDECRKALEFVAELVPALPSGPSDKMRAEFSRVMTLFLNCCERLLGSEERNASDYYRVAIGYLDDQYMDMNENELHCDDIPVLANERDGLLFRALVGRARALIIENRDLTPIENILSILDRLEEELNGSGHELTATDRIRLNAIRCLFAGKSDSKWLTAQVLMPLAQVIKASPNSDLGGEDALTAVERDAIEQLRDDVTDRNNVNPDPIPSDDPRQTWLAIITGGSSKLNALTRDAITQIQAWKVSGNREQLDKARGYLKNALTGIDGTSTGDSSQTLDPIQVTITELAQIVDLLVLLDIDEVSAEGAVKDFPAVLKSSQLSSLGLTYKLYEALLRRAEREVLGNLPELDADKMLDVAMVDTVIRPSGAPPESLTDAEAKSLHAWWAGVRAADAIHKSGPPYETVSKYCHEFLDLEPKQLPTHVSRDLRSVVQLCSAECKAALHLANNTASSGITRALDDSEVEQVRGVLKPIRDGIPKFRDYSIFGQALVDSRDSAAQDRVEAVRQLILALDTPSVRGLLHLRPERLTLVAGVILRAAQAQQLPDTSANANNRGFLETPFCPGGAKAAYEFLLYCREELGQKADEPANELMALAAFFRDSPDGPDYALAANITDVLLEEPGVKPEFLLINAQAHQQDPSGKIEVVETVLHSYARFVEVWENRSSLPPKDKEHMPSDTEFWKLVIEQARKVLEGSLELNHLAESLRRDPSSWNALNDIDKQFCRDAAKIIATRAQLLQDKPAIEITMEATNVLPDRSRQKEQILAQFRRASELVPDNVDYILDETMAYLDLPNLPAEQLATLKEITLKAKRADKEHAGCFILDGRCAIMQALLTDDLQSKEQLLRSAVTSCDEASKRASAKTDLLWNALVAIADAQVQLANTLDARDGSGGPEVERLLNAAVAAADDALELEIKRSATLLVKANAREDVGLLVGRTDEYRAALQLFAAAAKTAKEDRRNLVEARAHLGFGRTLYRLLLALGSDSTAPLDDKDPAPLTLESALQELIRAEESASKDAVTLSDVYLFQAQICELIARSPDISNDEKLKQLDKADGLYASCVEQAHAAGRPEASLWQLNRVKNAYHAFRYSDPDKRQAREKTMLDMSSLLIKTLITDKYAANEMVSQFDARILVGDIKILSDVPDILDVLSPEIDRLLASNIAADLKIHLHLLRAQYIFDPVCDVPRLDERTWRIERRKIDLDVDKAEELARSQTPAIAGLWKARIAGQRALVDWKAFQIAGAADRKKLGLAAYDSFVMAVDQYAQLDDRYAGEAICPRYRLGELTEDLLRNDRIQKEIPPETFQKMRKKAFSEVNKINKDMWRERQNQVRSYKLASVDWNWRFRERFEVICNDRGQDAPFERVTQLQEDILKLEKQ